MSLFKHEEIVENIFIYLQTSKFIQTNQQTHKQFEKQLSQQFFNYRSQSWPHIFLLSF